MRVVSAAVVASVLALGALPVGAQSANAQEMMSSHGGTKGLYVGLGAGVSVPRNADLSGTGISGSADSDTGYGLNLTVGNAYESNWRAELELGYRRSNVDKVAGADAAGDIGATSLMINGLRDFPTNSNWTPYVGLGLGGARINYDNVSPVGSTRIDDTATVFAYQGLAGVSYQINDQLSLFTDYRYFATLDPSFTADSGASVDGEYGTHQVMFGLRWSFGAPKKTMAPEPKPVAAPAPRPAPQPAPKAAPQPAPVAAPEIPRTYLVFFDWDRSNIRPDAAAILAQVAANYPKTTVIRIDATGHADRSGPDWYNMGLSERRAKAVQADLIRRGIPASDIHIDWKGERDPLVPTPDGVREPQNRRVEIVFR